MGFLYPVFIIKNTGGSFERKNNIKMAGLNHKKENIFFLQINIYAVLFNDNI